jgi:hypothetical protein
MVVENAFDVVKRLVMESIVERGANDIGPADNNITKGNTAVLEISTVVESGTGEIEKAKIAFGEKVYKKFFLEKWCKMQIVAGC